MASEGGENTRQQASHSGEEEDDGEPTLLTSLRVLDTFGMTISQRVSVWRDLCHTTMQGAQLSLTLMQLAQSMGSEAHAQRVETVLGYIQSMERACNLIDEADPEEMSAKALDEVIIEVSNIFQNAGQLALQSEMSILKAVKNGSLSERINQLIDESMSNALANSAAEDAMAALTLLKDGTQTTSEQTEKARPLIVELRSNNDALSQTISALEKLAETEPDLVKTALVADVVAAQDDSRSFDHDANGDVAESSLRKASTPSSSSGFSGDSDDSDAEGDDDSDAMEEKAKAEAVFVSEKLGYEHFNWKRRWFVNDGPVFRYYGKDVSKGLPKHPKGSFELTPTTSISSVLSGQAFLKPNSCIAAAKNIGSHPVLVPSSKPHVIEVSNALWIRRSKGSEAGAPTRTYYFAFDTKDEMKAALTVLKQATQSKQRP